MTDLPYTLINEATKERNYFGLSLLKGFAGVRHSIEDCFYRAKWRMTEDMASLKEQGLQGPATLN